jgi:hypothetical protein
MPRGNLPPFPPGAMAAVNSCFSASTVRYRGARADEARKVATSSGGRYFSAPGCGPGLGRLGNRPSHRWGWAALHIPRDPARPKRGPSTSETGLVPVLDRERRPCRNDCTEPVFRTQDRRISSVARPFRATFRRLSPALPRTCSVLGTTESVDPSCAVPAQSARSRGGQPHSLSITGCVSASAGAACPMLLSRSWSQR